MVSNIGDAWQAKFPGNWPKFNPPPLVIPAEVSRQEFENLRKEVLELRALLEAAKRFDEQTGQPDCEMDDKVKLIKAIAKLVGVDLKDIFGKSTKK